MIKDFIDNAGGATALAADLSQRTGRKLTRPQVAMWAVRDRIPWEWRAVLYNYARENGFKLPESVLEGVIVND